MNIELEKKEYLQSKYFVAAIGDNEILKLCINVEISCLISIVSVLKPTTSAI